MKEVNVNGKFGKTQIYLYSDIKEMPIKRYHELGKLILNEINIGDSIEDLPRHFSSLYQYVGNNNQEESLQEIKNLHNNLFNAIQGIDINFDLRKYIRNWYFYLLTMFGYFTLIL